MLIGRSSKKPNLEKVRRLKGALREALELADDAMVTLVQDTAEALGHSVRRMPSGAGHDAQMFAPNCPTAMIFVPSRDGISHNVKEYTAPDQIEAGANVLLQVLLAAAE